MDPSLLTGLRSGEARALRWDEVDLEQGVASVSWSLTEAEFAHGCGGSCGKKRAGNCPSRRLELAAELEWIVLHGRHVLVRPKNSTTREIPLTADAVSQLRATAAVEDAPNPRGLVWHRSDGSPTTNADDNKDLQAALGLPCSVLDSP